MSTRFPSTHSSLRVGLQCSQGWQRGNKRPLAVGFGWLCTLKTDKSVSRHVTKNIVRERSLPQRDSGDCSRNVCPSTARGKSKLIFAVWACPQIVAAIAGRTTLSFVRTLPCCTCTSTPVSTTPSSGTFPRAQLVVHTDPVRSLFEGAHTRFPGHHCLWQRDRF